MAARAFVFGASSDGYSTCNRQSARRGECGATGPTLVVR